jgi:hypothetical protein
LIDFAEVISVFFDKSLWITMIVTYQTYTQESLLKGEEYKEFPFGFLDYIVETENT